MSVFKALIGVRNETGSVFGWQELTEADLMDGDVVVRVSHSTLNYKDGLALTGKAPVVRRWPMIPGIDFAGTVESSQHPEFKAGDAVVQNGWGVGEAHFGGYAGMARVKGDWLIKMPNAFSAAEAMAIGTAGYTAMLCVMALERGGLQPTRGPVLVTGAAGGVGTIAVSLLAGLGYEVIASTGRGTEADVRKVALEEPPGNLQLTDAKVADARKALFGAWEMNWLAYNVAHDIVLPGAKGPALEFFMYPQAETVAGRLDCLDPDSFAYTITSKELAA